MNTVVVVDDSWLQLNIYRQLLEGVQQIEAVPFESSSVALDWCSAHEPDLVLIDYRMPTPNGLEFIASFRAIHSEVTVPLVMITGSEDKAVRYRALELGANDFLNKPIDPVEFRARVKNMLRVRDHGWILTSRAASLAEQVRRATAEIVKRENETIYRLSRAMEHSDNDTGDHIQRIGHFAARLATALDMPKEWAELLLLAAPMHDIGKVGTPDDILQKTGDLTPEEWEVMKAHTIAGYDILRDSSSELLRMGAEIALSHHERFDGSGYPFGLADEQIPLSARITALCDVFDTLLSTRPHKQPWPLAKVLDYIYEQEGGHFDPRVVAAFRTSLPDLLAIRSAFGSEHLQNGEQDLAQAEG